MTLVTWTAMLWLITANGSPKVFVWPEPPAATHIECEARIYRARAAAERAGHRVITALCQPSTDSERA